MFWMFAVLLCLVALAFLLVPLLRDPHRSRQSRQLKALDRARESGAIDETTWQTRRAELTRSSPAMPRPPLVLIGLLALGVPFTAAALYAKLGTPAALHSAAMSMTASPSGNPAANGAEGGAPNMEQAIAGLAERLRAAPDDFDGWLLLGRAYRATERFGQAAEALAQAYRLSPENPDVLVEYAEAQALASSTRRIEGLPLELLDKALSLEPDHQRGLWLRGVAAMQAGEPGVALTRWQKLRKLLASDAAAVASLDEQIAGARRAAGLPDSHGAEELTTDSEPTGAAGVRAEQADTPKLTVLVQLDPKLQAEVSPSDVLFVFARAAEGPRMPLAIQRLPAAGFPRTVVLDDSQSMMQGLTLSTQPRIVVGARISKSGQAIPQSGDFEAISDPMANTQRETVRLTISHVVP